MVEAMLASFPFSIYIYIYISLYKLFYVFHSLLLKISICLYSPSDTLSHTNNKNVVCRILMLYCS